MLLKEILRRHMNSTKIAIRHNSVCLSYQELHLRSLQIADEIKKTSLSNNVAIYLSNSIDYISSYFGILYADRTIVPISIKSKEYEIINIIEFCDIDCILTTTKYLESIKQIIESHKIKVNIVCVDLLMDDTLKCLISECVESDLGDEVALILNTSGSTSNPKRVMLTNKNLYASVMANIEVDNYDENEVGLVVIPLYHSYGNTEQLLKYIYLGFTIVILDQMFTAKRFFEVVEQEKITTVECVPSMLKQISEYNNKDEYNISSLKRIGFAGDKIPENIIKNLVESFPDITFVQAYGQTETSPIIAKIDGLHYKEKVTSVGKPIPGVDIIVADSRGNDLGSEQVGDVLVKGPTIMKGYLKNPEETKRAFVNGYLNTGDIGKFDKDGYLYILGRKKNLLKLNGERICSEEIEEILLLHPGIKEARVFEKEFDNNSTICCEIVLKDESVNEFTLREHCYQYLSNTKIPQKYFFVDNIEQTELGKMNRK